MKSDKNILGYMLLVVLLLAASFFSLRLFSQEKTMRDTTDIHSFPHTIGKWKGTDLEITEKEYQILETRNLIAREYVNQSNDKLSLFIIYSETNRSVFHPPEVCIAGGGFAIVDKQNENIESGKYKFSANKMLAEKGDFKELVLYAYKAGKLYTSNFYLQQAYLAIHQIFGKRVPGATIRVAIPIRSDEKQALAMLKSFLSETVKIVDSMTI
ncbi:MAG: exosortase C-terminal domain/associated protein EpsI [Candidatus Omnitrophota bacterium]